MTKTGGTVMAINGKSDTQVLNAISDFEESFKDIECHKNFECYKTKFSKLGQVKNHGKEKFLECLEEHAAQCSFSLPCEDKYYCLCPVRIDIANRLNL